MTGPALSHRAGPPPPGLGTLAVADGTVLAVRDENPRADADAVVLVHGWTQDHTSWDDVVPELRRQAPELRVIAHDARGHGWSDAGPRGTWTIDQTADDVAEVIDQLVPAGRVVVAGHSLGGPVIMALAERHPHLVGERIVGAALVATSAAGLGKDIFGLSNRLTKPVLLIQPLVTRVRAYSRAQVNTKHPNLLAVGIRQGFYGPGSASAHNRRRTAAQTARSHPATTAQLVDEMVRHDRLSTLGELDRIKVAVLAGTKDGLCPMDHSRAMAAAMPGAEFVVYPRAGHMLPYERPAEVAAEIVKLAR